MGSIITVVWLNEQPLDLNRRYILKHTTQTLPAEVKAVRHRVNIKTLEHEAAESLEMNGIGVLRIETSRPIYFDAYTQNRSTGSVILIDPETNATVGAGMILAPVVVERDRPKGVVLDLRQERVTPVERIARYRHGGETVSLGDRRSLAWLLERRLFDRGCAVTAVVEQCLPGSSTCCARTRRFVGFAGFLSKAPGLGSGPEMMRRGVGLFNGRIARRNRDPCCEMNR